METRHDCSTLLIDAPVGRHFAQFHRDSEGRAESIRLFVSAGLTRGNGVVVIATQSDREKLEEELNSSGHMLEEHRRNGQLVLLDSRLTLNQFMRNGMPDWRLFRDTVGTAITGVQSHRPASTRAYGDMVNLLWREGRQEAAIRLEDYWNELARLYPFSLFCGYMLDGRHGGSYDGPLHEIGRTHHMVLSSSEDQQFSEALDRASRDVFGVSITELPGWSTREDQPGEHRLPVAHAKMLFILRKHRSSSSEVLTRARHYLADEAAGASA